MNYQIVLEHAQQVNDNEMIEYCKLLEHNEILVSTTSN